jgi:ribonuclease T1
VSAALFRSLPHLGIVLLAVVLLPNSACAGLAVDGVAHDSATVVVFSELPPEARDTVLRIRRGGPFPYERDGTVFGNFERALPVRGRGYYREYTVPVPGMKQRGARRIVAGRAGELYYTDDHYRTFRRLRE